ncbi:aspartate 1-decarboxylase autocleavage activator PanM [Pluralibacter gergoviae]|nr:aspartate 1-decarboxylase autocleavage activator PanM [Pluralibacter gergoviae]ELK5594748.1 aspartate 1-decarboxylase autocleavage activator PanM [Pluralibacter gergoviae]
MKLTIIRLTALSGQELIDLGKIWPQCDAAGLRLDDAHRLYAARFNERLLGAVRVTFEGDRARLDDLCVREVTRRRGVGQYLLEETLRDNPGVSRWRMSRDGVEDLAIADAFMRALGFSAAGDGWEK